MAAAQHSQDSGLDAIARDLADGRISRRTAVRRFAGLSLTALLPGALFADAALARCPKSRRCHGKCCPRHAHCHRGKCKCNRGFTKCGKHCRDLSTDPHHCGSCDRRCADGETCHNGHCKPAAPSQVCGNNVREGSEACDGSDLGSEDCTTLDMGFIGGTLACASNCMSFDTSGCTSAECSEGATRDCYSGPTGSKDVGSCHGGTQTCTGGVWGACVGEVVPQPEICNGHDDDCDGTIDNDCTGCTQDTYCPDRTAECKTATCVSGSCQYTDDPQIGQPCHDSGVGACQGSGTLICNGSGAVICGITQPGAAPQPEICGNGIDDDCDGVVDNGCPGHGCSTDGECQSNLCCSGVCVDGAADANNCGLCGNVCQNGRTCVNGTCGVACASDTDCAGAIDGHHCLTYGFCGCRPASPDCPGAETCVAFVSDASQGRCL